MAKRTQTFGRSLAQSEGASTDRPVRVMRRNGDLHSSGDLLPELRFGSERQRRVWTHGLFGGEYAARRFGAVVSAEDIKAIFERFEEEFGLSSNPFTDLEAKDPETGEVREYGVALNWNDFTERISRALSTADEHAIPENSFPLSDIVGVVNPMCRFSPENAPTGVGDRESFTYGNAWQMVPDLARTGAGILRHYNDPDLCWPHLSHPGSDLIPAPAEMDDYLSQRDWICFSKYTCFTIICALAGVKLVTLLFEDGTHTKYDATAKERDYLPAFRNKMWRPSEDGWDAFYWDHGGGDQARRGFQQYYVNAYVQPREDNAYEQECARRKTLGLAAFGTSVGRYLAVLDEAFDAVFGFGLSAVVPFFEGTTLEYQAGMLVRRMLYAKARGASRVMWHTAMAQLADLSDDTVYPENGSFDSLYVANGLRNDLYSKDSDADDEVYAPDYVEHTYQKYAWRRPSWFALRRMAWLLSKTATIELVAEGDGWAILCCTASADSPYFVPSTAVLGEDGPTWSRAWIAWLDETSTFQQLSFMLRCLGEDHELLSVVPAVDLSGKADGVDAYPTGEAPLWNQSHGGWTSSTAHSTSVGGTHLAQVDVVVTVRRADGSTNPAPICVLTGAGSLHSLGLRPTFLNGALTEALGQDSSGEDQGIGPSLPIDDPGPDPRSDKGEGPIKAGRTYGPTTKLP